MAYKIKSNLSYKVAGALSSLSSTTCKIEPSTVLPFIKTKNSKNGVFEYTFDFEVFRRRVAAPDENSSKETRKLLVNQLLENGKNCDSIDSTSLENGKISFKVNPRNATKEVVNSVVSSSTSWKQSPLLATISPLKVVVEYSSPNIAKPFHVGHLRSTLIGNFIANISESVGHNVIRLNYLGDWGTQFGLLKYAFDVKGLTEEELSIDPIRKLYELYVWINNEAENDPIVKEKARQIFAEMEAGHNEHLSVWKLFRDYSIKDLEKSYKEIGIVFDKYDGESMYNVGKCNRVLDTLDSMGKLEDSEGRRVYNMPSYKVTLLKSDGSTLYLTRDLVAALERFGTYDFDRMLYVVEAGQCEHFKALKTIMHDLNPKMSDRIEHVHFGRISGMSTRKGNCVFLSDLMEEAKERKIQSQKDSKNTKITDPVDNIESAQLMGCTAIIYACLMEKKGKSYKFSWENALRNDKGGSYLQYAHCRLSNIENGSGYNFNPEANSDLLVDPVSVDLVALISQFDEVIHSSYESYESCILTKYLSKLATCANRAYMQLPVKNAPQPEAQSRLKLFRAAKITLAQGMNILGLKPVERM